MENAYSVEHHEHIHAGLWFLLTRREEYGVLILHNERGVFVQVRVVHPYCGPAMDEWVCVCRTCGALVEVGRNYQCPPCTRDAIVSAIREMLPASPTNE